MLSRRGFLLGLGALAAPAIVPYASLMPVKLVDFSTPSRYAPGDTFYWNLYNSTSATQFGMVIPDWRMVRALERNMHAFLRNFEENHHSQALPSSWVVVTRRPLW